MHEMLGIELLDMRRAVEGADHCPHPRRHTGNENVGEAEAGLLRIIDRSLLGGNRGLVHAGDDRAEQRFLGFEMMIERLPRQAGGFGHLLDRGAAKAVPAKHQHGRIEDARFRSHLSILTKYGKLSNRELVRRGDHENGQGEKGRCRGLGAFAVRPARRMVARGRYLRSPDDPQPSFRYLRSLKRPSRTTMSSARLEQRSPPVPQRNKI